MRKRGFEKIGKYEKSKICIPKRATKHSAGYDFSAVEDTILKPGKPTLVKTGIKAYMQDDEVLKLYIRSSYAKKGIILINSVGIIDKDYYNNEDNEGEIAFMLQNQSKQEVLIKKDERIGQGVFEKYLTIDDEEEITKKRKGGFGSTSGVTIIALIITTMLLIILSTATVIGAKHSIDNSVINTRMTELQIIQNAILKKEQKKTLTLIEENPIGRAITEGEFQTYNNYLTESSKEGYYLVNASDLGNIGVQKVKEGKEYIINWNTGEVLSINPTTYAGKTLKIDGINN